MRTTKPISAQILVDYTYHKKGSVPFGLVCVRNSFTLAREIYEESLDYRVFDERPDYRFIALKDRLRQSCALSRFPKSDTTQNSMSGILMGMEQ